MKTRYLYHLIRSDGRICYVGCSVNPYSRLIGHISEGRVATRHPGGCLVIGFVAGFRFVISGSERQIGRWFGW